MGRRIWIIERDTEITQEIIVEAKANNCPEIVKGIPPALEGLGKWVEVAEDEPAVFKLFVTEDMLPCAYEEPEQIEAEPPRDLAKEIDELKARVEKLERGIGIIRKT